MSVAARHVNDMVFHFTFRLSFENNPYGVPYEQCNSIGGDRLLLSKSRLLITTLFQSRKRSIDIVCLRLITFIRDIVHEIFHLTA